MKLALAALAVLVLSATSESPVENAGPEVHGNTSQQTGLQANQGASQNAPLNIKLLNTGKTDAEAAQDAHQIDVTNRLTEALIGATVLQFLALIGQGIYLRRSVRVAERALVEVERPWIFRGIVTIRWRDKDAMKPNDWCVKIAWKNVGRMPALIDRIEFKIKDKKSLPTTPDYAGADVLAFIPSLAQDQEHETGEVGIAKATDDNGVLIEYVFFGRVIYREMNGTERHSGFAICMSPYFPAAVEFNSAAYNYYI
jgi:hypothetical protein